VLAVLKRWSGTYIAEVERQHSFTAGELQRVRGWVLAPSFDKWPEDQVPGVLVVCTGLVPPPLKTGDGYYRARWNVQVGVLCSARTQQQSHEQAMLMLAAHKAIIAQHPSLEGVANGVQWIDEQYDALAYDDVRSLYAGTVTFAIEIADVLNTLDGPVTPSEPLVPETDPWPLDHDVETVVVEVDNYPDNASLPAEGGSS
jgi:hypothetical protein